MKIRPFHPADENSVIGLWRECGLTRPWNDPHRDIQRKLSEQPELFEHLKHLLSRCAAGNG